jgi:hypothetical protein
MDPIFRDYGAGDFRLMATACGDSADSPCIDAGHPDSIDAELSCHSGLGTSRADMGAFGGGGNLTEIGDHSLPEMNHEFWLENYPNPFNFSTMIEFTLPKREQVSLSIYDILGRKVVDVYDQVMEAGTHRHRLSLDAPSGVYLYTLKTEKTRITSKMMVVK